MVERIYLAFELIRLAMRIEYWKEFGRGARDMFDYTDLACKENDNSNSVGKDTFCGKS
jgi:hypothetical protein